MNENTKYWIWLQQSIGYANPKINTVLNFYESIQDFYNGGEKEWRLSGSFSHTELRKMYENSLEEAESLIEQCEKLQYTIITPDDKEYPKNLKEIYEPPSVLYVYGRLPDLENTLSIGIVGTRNATVSGKKNAYTISYDLAKAGVIIISGGALGIDSVAHNGALVAGGETVCVLGCGINYNYLSANANLRYEISRHGALISEYPPDTPASKYSFPRRNRIISALSQGILVVEAGKKSGALLTAESAQSQNKDIFAIPGDINNIYAVGTNNLIKQGAKPVTNALDILEEYRYKYTLSDITVTETVDNQIIENLSVSNVKRTGNEKTSFQKRKPNSTPKSISKKNIPVILNNAPTESKKELPSYISDTAKEIYAVICEKTTSLDDIINSNAIPSQHIMTAITELELAGLIVKDEAEGKYQSV